jgi:hypothetical protein
MRREKLFWNFRIIKGRLEMITFIKSRESQSGF